MEPEEQQIMRAVMGTDTATKRAANTMGITTTIANPIEPVKVSASTSKPIIRNSTEFKISSVSDQKLNRWPRVVSLMAKLRP